MRPASTENIPKLGYRPALDGIRGISILLVIGVHTGQPYFQSGFLGVDAFFVLSGFLITALLVGEYRRDGRMNIPAFYGRRVLRLIPALLFMLAVTTLYSIFFTSGVESAANNRQALWSLLYLGNWSHLFDPQPVRTLTDPTWSLAIEEQFYIVWPLVLLLLLRLRLRVTVGVVGLMIGAVAVWRAATWLQTGDWQRSYFGSDMRGDALLVGCLVGLLFAWGVLPRVSHRIAGMLLYISMPGFLFLNLTSGYEDPFLYLGGLTLFAAVVGIGVAYLMGQPHERVISVLSWKPLVWVGSVSFGIYLWHWAMFYMVAHSGIEWPSLPGVALGIAATALVATFSYYVIERPFLKLKDRWSRSRTKPQVLVPDGRVAPAE